MKSTLYFTKKTIYIHTSKESKLLSLSWKGQSLSPIFSKLKNHYKLSDIKVILGNDLSYVFGLMLKGDNKPTRKEVLQEAAKYIPEDITTQDFDWKQSGNITQVIATPPKFLNNLSLAAKKNNLSIESIDPISILIAKSTARLKKPHIIAYQGLEKIVMAAQKGIVFLSYSTPRFTKDTILQTAKLAKKQTGLTFSQTIGIPKFDKGITLPAQWQLDIKKVNIMATKSKAKKIKGKDEEVLEIKPIDKPEEPTIEPEPEIDELTKDTSKEDEKVEDQGSLASDGDKEEEVKEEEPTIDDKKKEEEPAIEPETETSAEDTPKEEETPEEEPVKEEEVKEEEPEQSSTDISETPEVGVNIVDTTEATASLDEEEEPKKKSSKGLVLSLLATLVVGGALTGGILYSRTSLDTRSKAAAPEATSTPAPEASSTEEALDLTEYSINILNGSGVAGQAGVVNDLLEEAGFESMDTGNADSYDFEETEISLAESTPEAVFDVIEKALEDDYEVKKSDAIEDDSDYDILIIVGQN